MRYILGFACLMALLTTPARMKGAEFVVVNNCRSFSVTNNCVAVRPALNIDPSHTCAKCGTYANVVKEEANGMHSHQCPRCGNEWWHADPPTAPLITLPASGCANGQCPAPSAPTRWRLFR